MTRMERDKYDILFCIKLTHFLSVRILILGIRYIFGPKKGVGANLTKNYHTINYTIVCKF